jgi:hypothetical protein
MVPTLAWQPFRYQGLAAREWDSEFSGASLVDHPPVRPAPHRIAVSVESWSSGVARIVAAFRTLGEREGFAAANRMGPLYLSGARLYVENRAAGEEDLARRVAELNALHARTGSPEVRIRRAFLEARLEEVRGAGRRAETPPQAVRDRPEVPVRPVVPHWVSYMALVLSASGVFLGWQAHQRATVRP